MCTEILCTFAMLIVLCLFEMCIIDWKTFLFSHKFMSLLCFVGNGCTTVYLFTCKKLPTQIHLLFNIHIYNNTVCINQKMCLCTRKRHIHVIKREHVNAILYWRVLEWICYQVITITLEHTVYGHCNSIRINRSIMSVW